MRILFTTTLLYLFLTAHLQAANGTVSIWAHHSIRNGNSDHVLELKVYVNNKYKGMLTSSFKTMDDCGQSGSVNFSLRPGEYDIQVRGIHRSKQNHDRQQTIDWGGIFTVEADLCTMIRVGNDESPTLIEDLCDTVGEVGIYLKDGIQEHLRDIKIYIDGEYAANISSYHSSARSCGDRGVLTRRLSCGPHTVEIVGIRKKPTRQESREYRATSSFILDGQCLMLPLDY